jgi:MFS superfamily sulfate permease-like transporter
MPGWLILMCGVCFFIPLARLAALLFAAGLCLIQPARIRRAASAWKGGKSHRLCGQGHPPGVRRS